MYRARQVIHLPNLTLDDKQEEEPTNKAKADAEQRRAKKLVNDAMEDDVKKLTLTILKNRNGKKTKVKNIDFYGANNYIDFLEY